MFQIRQETVQDNTAIRQIHERAFGQSAEADLVDRLRISCPDQISLVAVAGDQLVGHILFTPAKIEYTDGSKVSGIGLAPLAVLPEFQGKGVGSLLIQAGLDQLHELKQSFVIVLGHPGYYSRFGFEPAYRYQISCEFTGENREAFMIYLLNHPAFQAKEGVARYHPDFSAFA
ncbi:N-acetyltransferase [uncultured Gimesia sp.]|jgi:putative acetyltransferase|uniref:GNAT family N-acetyltransferase n=1 Tax=uncultured Gimesia sp. TaxID=1678688 RepID=UPI002610519A|nr:N-acetyltransferase [uncultured Gimesia sp.]